MQNVMPLADLLSAWNKAQGDGGSLEGGFGNARIAQALGEIGGLSGFHGNALVDKHYTATSMTEGGESSFQAAGKALNPELLKALEGYSVQQNPGEFTARLIDPSGRDLGPFTSGDKPTAFDKFAEVAIPLALAALAGGALSGASWATGGAGGLGAGGVGAAGIGAGEGAAQLAAYTAANPLTAAQVAGSTLPGSLGAVGSAGGALGGLGALGGGTVGGGITAPTLGAGAGLGSGLGTAGGAGGIGGAGATAAAAAPFSWGALGKAAIGPALGLGAQLVATKQAGDSLKESTAGANALNREIFYQTREDNMPALEARNSGLAQLQALLKDPSTITSDPGYQFGLDQGTKTLANGAAARGMTYSGAQGKALTRFGQDYAGSKIDDSARRLLGLASAGQPGASTLALSGANYAGQVGNNLTAQGSADASRYLVNGGAIANTINGLSAYGTRQGWWGG